MKEMFKDLMIKTLIVFLILLGYTVISFATGSFEKQIDLGENISEQRENLEDDLENVKEDDAIAGYGFLIKGGVFGFSVIGYIIMIVFLVLMQVIPTIVFFWIVVKNFISYLLMKGELKKWKLNTSRVLWILSIIEYVLLLIMFVSLFPLVPIIPFIGIMTLVLIFMIYYNIKEVRKNELFKKYE
ncbi:MAG: hypothetical protein E7157_01615 [Lactobacillales bacterium]|nr:hypothetical protein [Lactobacillales bacterium]